MAAAAEEGKPRVVIVGVDGSHRSERAFDWYADYLHRPENEVLVINVLEVQHTHVFQSSGLFITSEVWEAQIEKAKQASKSIQDKYLQKMKDRDMDGQYFFETGKPGERICQIAFDESAEMIVVGTRGSGKLRRTILGSVSDYIVHHAHCPVVTVRKDHTGHKELREHKEPNNDKKTNGH